MREYFVTQATPTPISFGMQKENNVQKLIFSLPDFLQSEIQESRLFALREAEKRNLLQSRLKSVVLCRQLDMIGKHTTQKTHSERRRTRKKAKAYSYPNQQTGIGFRVQKNWIIKSRWSIKNFIGYYTARKKSKCKAENNWRANR